MYYFGANKVNLRLCKLQALFFSQTEEKKICEIINQTQGFISLQESGIMEVVMSYQVTKRSF